MDDKYLISNGKKVKVDRIDVHFSYEGKYRSYNIPKADCLYTKYGFDERYEKVIRKDHWSGAIFIDVLYILGISYFLFPIILFAKGSISIDSMSIILIVIHLAFLSYLIFSFIRNIKSDSKKTLNQTIKKYQLGEEDTNNKKILDDRFPGIRGYQYNIADFSSYYFLFFLKHIKFSIAQEKELLKQRLEYIQSWKGEMVEDWWKRLDPYQFEVEVAKWFKERGYKVYVTKKSNDGGVDIIITNGDYKAYVQCKRYTKSKVDAPTVSQLYGVVAKDKVSQGIIVCLLGVTKDAQEFIYNTGMKVYTLKDLIRKNEPTKYDSEILQLTKQINSLHTKYSFVNSDWIKIDENYIFTKCYDSKDDLPDAITRNELKPYNSYEQICYYECLNLYYGFVCCNVGKFEKGLLSAKGICKY